jgi:hypothetical protein
MLRADTKKNWIITFFLSVLLLWKNIAKDKKVIPDPIEPAVNRNIKYKKKDDYCRFSWNNRVTPSLWEGDTHKIEDLIQNNSIRIEFCYLHLIFLFSGCVKGIHW